MHRKIASGTFIAMALCIGAAPALAGSSYTEQKRSVSIRVDGSSYELEGWLFRPKAEGKRPLAVLAHGTCGKRCRRRADGRETYMDGVARLFAGSGYAAYAFNRIGYGGSDGYLAQSYRSHETHGGCHTQDYETAGRLVADQIGLVVAELAKAPFVDPDRVVAMGHSGGGLGAIALAGRRPSGLLGVISASGARGGACADGDYLGGGFFNRNMTVAYRNFGLGSSLPALMLYAENDRAHRESEVLARRLCRRGRHGRAGGLARSTPRRTRHEAVGCRRLAPARQPVPGAPGPASAATLKFLVRSLGDFPLLFGGSAGRNFPERSR